MVLRPGYNYIWISAVVKNTASLDGQIELHVDRLTDNKGKAYKVQEKGTGFAKRKAFALRKAGEDNIHTYRIPGITTTNKGTLIAVYDNRYTTSRDLPGNVDVGMNRN
jgi:sialidase-1